MSRMAELSVPMKECPECAGRGWRWVDEEQVDCVECGGSGLVRDYEAKKKHRHRDDDEKPRDWWWNK